MTDEWLAYQSLGEIYDHSFVKHKIGEYVRGKVHTNTIEGFWACSKRGYVGTYHKMTRKYLQLYIDESVFRYKTKNYTEQERFNCFFENMEGSRLKYKDLIVRKAFM